MDDAPDYRELSDDEIEQVLEAAGTSLREFLRLSPDVQQGEWENAWSLSQYNLANDREASTSASAALENRAAATPPDVTVPTWAAPKLDIPSNRRSVCGMAIFRERLQLYWQCPTQTGTQSNTARDPRIWVHFTQ